MGLGGTIEMSSSQPSSSKSAPADTNNGDENEIENEEETEARLEAYEQEFGRDEQPMSVCRSCVQRMHLLFF